MKLIKATFKQKMILVFLALAALRMAPDFIKDRGWETLRMGWVWFLLFLILLWIAFVGEYSKQQAVDRMREDLREASARHRKKRR